MTALLSAAAARGFEVDIEAEREAIAAGRSLRLTRGRFHGDDLRSTAKRVPIHGMRGMSTFAMIAATAIACSSTGGTTGTDGGAGDDASTSGDGGTTGCRRDLDCRADGGNGGSCARVEDPICGGPAPPNECANDSDCADSGADFVCESAACGGHVCIAKCKTNAECTTTSPALACNALGRCRAKPCALSTDCPTNFLCGVDKECNAKPCFADADCAAFCVHGTCSSAPGVCRLPVP